MHHDFKQELPGTHKAVCRSLQPENAGRNEELQTQSRFEIKTNRTSKNKTFIITRIKIPWTSLTVD